MRALIKTAAGAVLGSVIAEKTNGKGLLGAGLGVLATRIATRSIPGAVLVGGALVAKTLYDRRRDGKPLPKPPLPRRIAKKSA